MVAKYQFLLKNFDVLHSALDVILCLLDRYDIRAREILGSVENVILFMYKSGPGAAAVRRFGKSIKRPKRSNRKKKSRRAKRGPNSGHT